MAHTRWATHGPVCIRNSHPHTSSHQNEFIVVHNGVVTNYKEIKSMLEKHGHVFESDTDTEVVAKLCLYFYKELKSQHEKIDFKKVVLKVTSIVVRINDLGLYFAHFLTLRGRKVYPTHIFFGLFLCYHQH
jgi:glucosamine 6-phosphate synthetase-like amidotransferase/phosphosugar isomerase protein